MKLLYFLIILSLFLTGCTSIPQVRGEHVNVAEGIYAINIHPEFTNDPKEVKYAINSWVKKQGFTSYDFEVRRFGKIATCYVTIPGSTPVEDLPLVKHISRNKTNAAILAPLGGIIIAYSIIMPMLMVYLGN